MQFASVVFEVSSCDGKTTVGSGEKCVCSTVLQIRAAPANFTLDRCAGYPALDPSIRTARQARLCNPIDDGHVWSRSRRSSWASARGYGLESRNTESAPDKDTDNYR